MSSLDSQGTGYLTMANERNELIQIWRLGFLNNGQKVPYYLAEDLESCFKALGQKFSVASFNSEFTCVDNAENRTQLLKFLFGERLAGFSDETHVALNKYLNSKSDKTWLKLKLDDSVYSIKGGSQ